MLTRRDVLGTAAVGFALPAAFVPVPRIVVSPRPFPTLACGDLTLACVVGRTGVRQNKREGDGATPVGRYPLRQLLYRPDRVAPVASRLPVSPLHPTDGWSDDPGDPSYNQLVSLPSPRHHEDMWRSDHLYDIVIVIGYNDAPAIPGKGSAIFLHVASPGLTGTDGCVAIPLPAIVKLAALCDTTTIIEIRN